MTIGKSGSMCPFKPEYHCNDKCGLFCIGLKSCVFHAINLNLGELNKSMKIAARINAGFVTKKDIQNETE